MKKSGVREMKLLVKTPAIWPETEPWSVGITSLYSLPLRYIVFHFQGNHDVLNILNTHFHSEFQTSSIFALGPPHKVRWSLGSYSTTSSPKASGKGHRNEQGFHSKPSPRVPSMKGQYRKEDFLPTAQSSELVKEIDRTRGASEPWGLLVPSLSLSKV